MHILIAEDDAVTRTIIQKCVEKLGHTCLLARDGAQAWDYFQDNMVDVVISDWMMPGLSGIELCQRIRAMPPQVRAYTYIILLTGMGEKAHFISGMQAGADDYLLKPLDRDALQARLISASRVTTLHKQLMEQKAELEHLNQKLFDEGRIDALTRLRNRLSMQEDLPKFHDRCRRYGHTMAVALCDIDSYKLYNDYYGHLAGDDVLRTVSRAISDSVRVADLVYRYGGEEFLVLLPEQSLDTAGEVMNRVRKGIYELGIPHVRSNHGHISVSIGVSVLSAGATWTVDELLKQADEALYRAKESGRNRVMLFQENGQHVPIADPSVSSPL